MCPDMAGALVENDTAFGKHIPDLIQACCSCSDQPLSNTVYRLDIVLLLGFQRNRFHVWALHGFTNCGGIVSVVLVPNTVRSDITGVDPSHLMAQ